jgi:hypothetical protein
MDPGRLLQKKGNCGHWVVFRAIEGGHDGGDDDDDGGGGGGGGGLE